MAKLPSIVRKRTQIVELRTMRPSFLPFHVLSWGQFYIQTHNCPPPDATQAERDEFQSNGHISQSILLGKNASYLEHYRICTVNVFHQHHNIPLYAVLHPSRRNPQDAFRRSLALATKASRSKTFVENSPSTEDAPSGALALKGLGLPGKMRKATRATPFLQISPSQEDKGAVNMTSPEPFDPMSISELRNSIPTNNPRRPIKLVYYTEMDQVVRFDFMETMQAIASACNDTTFVSGYRREKRHNSDPADYMGNLTIVRHCGAAGFSMIWPKENIIRQDTT
jgi:hypothetical protein